MQRVTQMNVIPDVLGDIYPEADVRIKVAGETIEPGVFTLPAQVRTFAAHSVARGCRRLTKPWCWG